MCPLFSAITAVIVTAVFIFSVFSVILSFISNIIGH